MEEKKTEKTYYLYSIRNVAHKNVLATDKGVPPRFVWGAQMPLQG